MHVATSQSAAAAHSSVAISSAAQAASSDFAVSSLATGAVLAFSASEPSATSSEAHRPSQRHVHREDERPSNLHSLRRVVQRVLRRGALQRVHVQGVRMVCRAVAAASVARATSATTSSSTAATECSGRTEGIG